MAIQGPRDDGRCVHDGGPCLHERIAGHRPFHGADHRWLLPPIAHGRILQAILLPYTIEWNSSGWRARGRYEGLAARWAWTTRAGRAATSTRAFGTCVPWQDAGIDETTPGVAAWRRTFSEMGRTKTNPVIPTVHEFAEILERPTTAFRWDLCRMGMRGVQLSSAHYVEG